jgi:tetratricopeptide (TPR) repeat protein
VIDATKGTQVWGDRLELADARPARDQQSLFERLTRQCYEAVFGAEVARSDKPPAASASAVESVLYANNYWARNPVSVQGALGATEYFDRALQLDPNLVPALLGKSAAIYYVMFLDPHVNHEQLVQEMDALSIRAATIDEKNPNAWWIRAVALGLQWRWEAAVDAIARAQRLDPGSSDAISVHAELMLYAGQPYEALGLAEKALALEPANSVASGWPLHTRCRASLALERYEEAIVACEKSASLHDWWLPHLYLVAAYTHQGQAAKAAAERAKVLKQRPGISVADFKALRLSDNPAFLQQTESRLFNELRKAGIPEN